MADETGEVRTQKLDPEAEARRRLALAQIRQYPDPVLRMRAREVEEFDGDLAKLAERLTHLLSEANGLGLAATQIGVLRRAFAFLPDPEQEARVLVLDEPTAHLDTQTAQTLVEDVFAAAGDRCVLLITHRPEGLDLADELVVLPDPLGPDERRMA